MPFKVSKVDLNQDWDKVFAPEWAAGCNPLNGLRGHLPNHRPRAMTAAHAHQLFSIDTVC